MNASRIVSVDIGATHVTCAQFCPGKNGKPVLQQIEREPLAYEPANDGGWLGAVEVALAAVVRRRSWRGEVHLAIPGHLALTRCVTTPRVASSKLGAVMAFEASRSIPYPLEQVEWDYVVNAERGGEIETLLMAVKAEPMRALCEAVAASGLELSRAVPASMALARAFRCGWPQVDSGVLVEVGARSTHVILFERERLLPRTLSLAGNTLTQAIADGLGVESARAEAFKLQHLAADFDPGAEHARHATVVRAAQEFAERLRREISRSIASGRNHAFGSAPEAVYLSGGGAAFEALPLWLREQLALPVHRLELLWEDVAVMGDGREKPPRRDVIGVIGLAAASGGAAPNGNLLPPKWRAEARFRRRQPVILAIAALLVAALFPPIWSYDREVRNAGAENTVISDQLRSLQENVARHASAVTRLEETRQQLGALRRLAKSQANWTGFFAELQQSLVQVEDVWLDRLDVIVAEKPAETAGGSTEVSAEPLPRLRFSGRVLDRKGEGTASANEAEMRIERLLANVGRSRFVRAIEAERFDTSRPGILHFEFSVTVNPGSLF